MQRKGGNNFRSGGGEGWERGRRSSSHEETHLREVVGATERKIKRRVLSKAGRESVRQTANYYVSKSLVLSVILCNRLATQVITSLGTEKAGDKVTPPSAIILYLDQSLRRFLLSPAL
jgi:hypothetical protein